MHFKDLFSKRFSCWHREHRVYQFQLQRCKSVHSPTHHRLDLCGKQLEDSIKHKILTWTTDPTPCKTYFCSATPGMFYKAPADLSNPIGFSVPGMLANNDTFHYLLQQYCTKCQATYGERFDITLTTDSCSSFIPSYCNTTYSCGDPTMCFNF
jgi:hypothetical protein